MAKMRTKALRQLHADLGKILEDYDASCAAQAADEDDSDTPAADGPANAHSRNRAHDEAPRDGISMTEAFPGFTHNGPLRRK